MLVGNERTTSQFKRNIKPNSLNWLFSSLQTIFINFWITISHLFICLPTLEVTTFEQQVYTNVLSKETNSCQKKECSHFEQRRAHQAERECNLCGWLKRQQGDLHTFF